MTCEVFSETEGQCGNPSEKYRVVGVIDYCSVRVERKREVHNSRTLSLVLKIPYLEVRKRGDDMFFLKSFDEEVSFDGRHEWDTQSNK